MLIQYNKLLAQVAFLEDDALKYNFYFSLLRSILQLSSITAFDLSWDVSDESGRAELSAVSKTLLQPSDGDFVSSLDVCLQILRISGWRNCVPNWFDSVHKKLGASPIRGMCLDLIKERNSKIGHGVVDKATVLRSLQSLPEHLKAILDGLQDLFPDCSAANKVVSAPFENARLQTIADNVCTPIIIRKFSKSGSCWRASVTSLSLS